MSKSKNNCCVFGCKNSYANCSEGTKFYAFPAECRFPGRKNLWIQAVRRIQSDKLWEPSKNSKVCSNHFIGNVKSDHPEHPDYIPSIFPEYNKSTSLVNSTQKVNRFNRAFERKRKRESYPSTMAGNSGLCLDQTANDSEDLSKKVSIGINCCITEELESVDQDYPRCEYPILFSSISKEGSATQTFIPPKMVFSEQVTQTENLLLFSETVENNEDTITEESPRGFKGIESVRGDDKLKEVAGVNFVVFEMLLNILEGQVTLRSPKIEVMDRLLIFLMKMKLGISYAALGVVFGVHRTTISRIFDQVLDVLVFNTLNYIYWPSKSKIRETLPEAFKPKYSNCRAILDCTEIKTECPPDVDQRVLMYSSYKSAFTVKYLVAITPAGFISFISQGYGGRTGDCFITNDCGILNLVESGDLYLADKGFPTITATLNDKNAVLVMPPFARGSSQFNAEEVATTYEIASVRIHVERCIQRMKIYNILQKVECEQLPIIDKIVRMCCVLANLQPPIIKNK